MYLAQGPNLSPLDLRGFILIIFVLRLYIKPLLLLQELFCLLYCKLNGVFVFGEKKGLYRKVNDVADTSNPVVNGKPGRETLLQNLTELIVTAVIVTYIWYS